MPFPPKISIAMATFNGEDYIEEQLDSIISQTLKPDEIIICDDLSSDKTRSIISTVKKESDIQIKYFKNKKRLGFGQNFAKAIKMCKGDLVFLSDQDDFWFKDKIKNVVSVFNLNRDQYVFYNETEFCDKNLNPSGIFKMNYQSKLGTNFIQGCCAMIRSELIPLILPIPAYVAHDSWIGYIGRALDIIHFNSVSLQYYRIHDSNSSDSAVNNIFESYHLNKLKELNKKSHVQGLEFEIKIKKDLMHRLKNKVPFTLEINSKYDNILIKLSDEIKYWENRLGLMDKNLILRTLNIIHLLIKGHYQKYSNAKSAIKDFIII